MGPLLAWVGSFIIYGFGELVENSCTDDLIAGAYRITWTPYTSSRFDSTRFKKDHADLAAAYTKTTTARRFSVR